MRYYNPIRLSESFVFRVRMIVRGGLGGRWAIASARARTLYSPCTHDVPGVAAETHPSAGGNRLLFHHFAARTHDAPPCVYYCNMKYFYCCVLLPCRGSSSRLLVRARVLQLRRIGRPRTPRSSIAPAEDPHRGPPSVGRSAYGLASRVATTTAAARRVRIIAHSRRAGGLRSLSLAHAGAPVVSFYYCSPSLVDNTVMLRARARRPAGRPTDRTSAFSMRLIISRTHVILRYCYVSPSRGCYWFYILFIYFIWLWYILFVVPTRKVSYTHILLSLSLLPSHLVSFPHPFRESTSQPAVNRNYYYYIIYYSKKKRFQIAFSIMSVDIVILSIFSPSGRFNFPPKLNFTIFDMYEINLQIKSIHTKNNFKRFWLKILKLIINLKNV